MCSEPKVSALTHALLLCLQLKVMAKMAATQARAAAVAAEMAGFFGGSHPAGTQAAGLGTCGEQAVSLMHCQVRGGGRMRLHLATLCWDGCQKRTFKVVSWLVSHHSSAVLVPAGARCCQWPEHHASQPTQHTNTRCAGPITLIRTGVPAQLWASRQDATC
jgi:hypothetical protein